MYKLGLEKAEEPGNGNRGRGLYLKIFAEFT